METILAVVLSPIAVASLVILALLFEYNSRTEWSAFMLVVGGIISAVLSGVSITTIGIVAACYVPIGAIYSFWRWRRFVRTVVREINDKLKDSQNGEVFLSISNGSWSSKEAYTKEQIPKYITEEYTVGNYWSKIVGWIVIWPISVIDSFVGDIIDMLRTLVTGWLAGAYNKITKNALEELD